MSPPILWYYVDPMCSWCWGFSPVMEAIRTAFGDQLKIALMLGGLRPGTTESVTDHFREEILHHWRDVHRLTGQRFNFDGAMPDGFVYDTEPASRAVATMGVLSAENIFPYFKAVQSAFYSENIDVTQADNLVALASEFGVDAEQFLTRFNSDEMIEKTRQHFALTRRQGVSGFPTLILQKDEKLALLASGYRPFDELKADIEAHLLS